MLYVGGPAVENLTAMQEIPETQVQSLGWEGPLEEKMAIQSSILAWKIPWTEEPNRLQSMGLQRVRHDWAHTLTLDIQMANKHEKLLNITNY